MKLHEALWKAVRQSGISVLQEKRLLYILADCRAFDEYPAMRQVFRALVTGALLKDLSGGSNDGCLASARALRKTLADDWHFMKEFADYAIDCLLFALGLKQSVTEPSDHGFDPLEKPGAASRDSAAGGRSAVKDSSGEGREHASAAPLRRNEAVVSGQDGAFAVTSAGTGVEKTVLRAGGTGRGCGRSRYFSFPDFGDGARSSRKIKLLIAIAIIAGALAWCLRGWLSGPGSAPDSSRGTEITASAAGAGAAVSTDSPAAGHYAGTGEQAPGRYEFEQGEKYYSGRGVSRDYAEALRWYRKAADLGHAAAYARIGAIYYSGDGVRQNYAEALRCFRKAAELGIPDAAGTIGWMYEHGTGVRQDYGEAAKWYRMAAEQGHEASRISLGFMYENGMGVPKDREEALKWYRMAADQGSLYAKDRLSALGAR